MNINLRGPEIVEAQRTPLLPLQAARAIQTAYRGVVGSNPSRNVLSNLMAQWAFESGNGSRMWRYNFGNEKWTGQSLKAQYLRCSEYVTQPDGSRKKITYPIPHPSCRFAAFDSAPEGARAHILLLRARSNWWSGLHSGTLTGFNVGLSSSPRYYTADATAYLKGLVSRARAHDAVSDQVWASGGGDSSLRWPLVMAAGAGAYWLIRKKRWTPLKSLRRLTA